MSVKHVEYKKIAKSKSKYTVSYSADHGGYIKQYGGKSLKYCLVDRATAYRVKAGYYEEVFPEFDNDKHSIYVDIPYGYMTEQCRITLSDITVEEDVKLPFGSYTIKIVNGTSVLIPLTITMDEYVDFGQSAGAKFYEDFVRFQGSKDIYKEEGQIRKKGAFAFGPPGCGKTMEIFKLLSHAKKNKFFGVIMGSRLGMDTLLDFRDTLEEYDKVIVLEEITERLEFHPAEEMLSFLDGETSWNNCYSIATTNFPELLDPNLIDRPRRFSKICYVDYPGAEAKRTFLRSKKVAEKDIEFILEYLGKNISMDYVREIVLLSRLEKRSFKHIIDEIKTNRKLISKSFKGTIGLRNDSGNTPKIS